jgi:hypothetical protein
LVSTGGHCKPLTYFGYPEERKMRGAKLANEMLVFEESHLARYAALVEAEDLDCDLHVTRGTLAYRPLLPCATLEADQAVMSPSSSMRCLL